MVVPSSNNAPARVSDTRGSSTLSVTAPAHIPSVFLNYTAALDAGSPPSISTRFCDNNNGKLTQSQMFKADDSPKFIQSQSSEIKSLLNNDVMAVHPISNLPLNY
jgi:hypothetical protein